MVDGLLGKGEERKNLPGWIIDCVRGGEMVSWRLRDRTVSKESEQKVAVDSDDNGEDAVRGKGRGEVKLS